MISRPCTVKKTPASANFIVECKGLAREEIGDDCFEYELWARRHWLAENCREFYEVTALRDRGRLVGRKFSFECATEATGFKLSFATRLGPFR